MAKNSGRGAEPERYEQLAQKRVLQRNAFRKSMIQENTKQCPRGFHSGGPLISVIIPVNTPKAWRRMLQFRAGADLFELASGPSQ